MHGDIGLLASSLSDLIGPEDAMIPRDGPPVFSIGRVVGDLRRSKGLTLSELRERTRLSVGYLSKLERDTANPTVEVLVALARSLGVGLGSLLGVPGDESSPPIGGPLAALRERLLWARQEQGLTLREASNRTELTESYLCQLENGGKINPTVSALRNVCAGLRVTLPFLLGYMPDFRGHVANQLAKDVGTEFRRYVETRRLHEHNWLGTAPVHVRVKLAVDSVCHFRPHVFAPVVLACVTGHSVQGFVEVLEGAVDPAWEFTALLARGTGIPVSFFSEGSWEQTPKPSLAHAIQLVGTLREYRVSS